MIAKAEMDLSDVLNMTRHFRADAMIGIGVAVRDCVEQFETRIRNNNLQRKGDDGVDSRQLRKALKSETKVSSGNVTGRVYFRGHWEPVARIHEHGTTGAGGTMPPIRPKRVKWLTIPLPGAFKGQSRGKALRAIRQQNTFFAWSKKHNLLMFRKNSKTDIEPIFVLKKKVELKPRIGFYRDWDVWTNKSGAGWKIILAGRDRLIDKLSRR